MGNQIGVLAAVGLLSLVLGARVNAAPKDLGNGFTDYGVAAPISNHRGTAALVDGEGKNVLAMWLMDHRGGYECLVIDAGTGKSTEVAFGFFGKMPEFDAPYASIVSSEGKFYTHFNSHFVEFDPKRREFTFEKKTAEQMAMSMTQDDGGVIWSVTYPQSGVVSFDPKTREFRDYGHVYKQNWPQYQRYIAADDAGWIYFAIGSTASQIIILDPKSGKARPVLEEGERKKGMAYLYRDEDGKVYGKAMSDESEPWWELYKGEAKKIGKREGTKKKVYRSGGQGYEETSWPDGMKVKSCDLVERKLTIVEPGTKKERVLAIDYASDGAHTMGLCATGEGRIAGGTTFPMRCFWVDTKSGELTNRAAYMQWNTVARSGDHYFVGGYPGGYLLDWEPAKQWTGTKKGDANGNPAYYIDCDPQIHRPTSLLPTKDGKWVILAGTPQYGYTGGGLLFWDREKKKGDVIGDEKLVADQSVQSMVELGEGKLLCGTTTTPGTGGEKKAKEAKLYVLDRESRKIEWSEVVMPGVQEYTELCAAGDGKVYGVADRKVFFVFDPVTKKLTHRKDVEKELGLSAYGQGPRIFIRGDGGRLFVLFRKCIVELIPATNELKIIADAPKGVEITSGGDWWEGKIYFVSESHICSYTVNR